jgi:Uncharacterized conserved protein
VAGCAPCVARQCQNSAMTQRLTLADISRYQEDIRKSRFLALAAPVATAEQAMDFFSRHADPAATHNCWAYRIGQQYRANDDGEPGGTAGRPILQAIDGLGFDRVAVLVTRWFGGIKLGAGGLVRAYGGVAANCLRAGTAVTVVETVRIRCAVGFADQARVRARLEQAGASVTGETYHADGVQWEVAVARDQAEALAALYRDLTRGQGMWQVEAE